MALTAIDWAIVAAYFILSTAIGFAFTKKGGESLSEYFISGRNVSWWLAGASMVATTFAADTPLVVTGFVYNHGVAGNWLWWNMLMSGMLTVFFFARLWRRAHVMTDVEFAEIRYAGKPAAVLRGFRALYLALPSRQKVVGLAIGFSLSYLVGTLWFARLLRARLGPANEHRVARTHVRLAAASLVAELWAPATDRQRHATCRTRSRLDEPPSGISDNRRRPE